MSELNGSDVNVERIMYDIREAVARQHNGTPTVSQGAPAVFTPNSTPENGDSLRLQPPFQPKRDNHYHVTDLLRFHGVDFIRNAYLALLLREPDQDGMAHYMDALASGHFNKIDILESLRVSPEGRRNNVRVDGLALPVAVRRAGRIPILGYVIRLMIAVVRLPRLIQHQNQFEFYMWPQLQRVADYENQSRREAAEAVAQVSSQVLDLSQQHQALTQQHQTLTQHHQALTTRQVEFGNAIDARFAEFENELESLKADWDPELDDLYASFEDRFRGEREEVQRRLEVYVPLLIEAGITNGVLDIGAGRGEWLRLLRDNHIACRGVDRNRVFIEECRRSGLDVAEADAFDHLQELPANSLNVVTSFHLVEHLPFEVLIKLLDEIERILKPGGLVILETPNPENFMVGSFSFYADPTHRNPIPSETLEFLLESRGFTDTKVWKLRPWEAAKLEGDSELIRRFNEFFYSAPDYAVIAKKP
ncbi:MAG TPA: methyltransferase domain-containing protein [Pyrinomonadaceae bacterium]|nr:methyltransferase domain-containing protein [Pyrinomonadaceae bacterium]